MTPEVDYVILTSKPGIYRTELGPSLSAIEAYDYLWFGRIKAHFVIARLEGPTRVCVVDESPPPVINQVPSKFLPKYRSVDAARAELAQLVQAGGADASLLRRVDSNPPP